MLKRRKARYDRIDAFSHKTTISLQKTRGVKHDLRLYQEDDQRAKDLMRKIKKKDIYTAIFDRLQRDETVHETAS